MKTFLDMHSLREAIEYSLHGSQALHVWQPTSDYKEIPKCFKQYHIWAHLFDQDTQRLVETGKALGVKCIKIEHEGKAGQHIDLCGQPLLRALDLAEKELDSQPLTGYIDNRKGDDDYGNRQSDSLGVSKLARSGEVD